MKTTVKTEVLIVGAGPTGLSLAAQLIRYGVNFVLVDKKEDVTNLSKALVVHARTLEIYDQLGLAQTAVQNGTTVQNAVILHGGSERATLDFGTFGGPLSPFPFALIFEQSKNERLMLDFVQNHGHTVQWESDLRTIAQNATGVQAIIETANGQTQTIEARYLIGCDGASSTTRHLLDLDFEGSTYPRIFFVADVDVPFDKPHDSLYASFEANSFLMLFPMQGEKHWRLLGPLPQYEKALHSNPMQDVNVTFDDVADEIKATIKQPLPIEKVHWFSTYKVHTRRAPSFRQQRCFIAGDAAHVHTPAGGQGMNTGIQDGYNLAWKLAFVLKHGANDSLLDTYNTERVENAIHLLHTTDQFFDVAAGDTWYQRFFRDNLLPGLARFAWRFDAAKEFVFPTLSQIGSHYPNSSLSQHEGDNKFAVKAGDRMPYFVADGVGIYDRLRKPCFHLLHFTDQEPALPPSNAGQSFRDLLEVHSVPLVPHAAEQFGTQHPFSVLLRPDNYIGLLAPAINENDLTAYFGALGIAPSQ